MGEGKHLYKKKCPVLFGHYLFRVGGYKPFLWSFLITFRGSKRLSGWCAWMTEHMWQEHGLRENKMFLAGSFLKLADDDV